MKVKYTHQMHPAMQNAGIATRIELALHLTCDMSATTPRTASSNTMRVKSSNRSGRCEVSSGACCNTRRLPSHGVAKSTASPATHSAKRAGGGVRTETAHNLAPRLNLTSTATSSHALGESRT